MIDSKFSSHGCGILRRGNAANRASSLIYDPNYAIGLVSIAGWASKTQVFKFCQTAKRLRKNVFDLDSHNCEIFTRLAIGAPLREMSADPSPEIGSNIVAQIYSSVLI
jgi:hypothetical protein